jgi:orotate phosphoribosyltransferase
MNLFQTGDFKLHSGQESKWKIECDALTREDWDTLALMIAERSRPFFIALGVPRGGLPLSSALAKYADPEALGSILIVDDVWTTGGSMNAYIEKMRRDKFILDKDIVGRWSVFARGPLKGSRALFKME